MMIEIPDDTNWVTGMATDDWEDTVQVKVDGKTFAVPKIVAYLIDKLDCKSKDLEKMYNIANNALINKGMG